MSEQKPSQKWGAGTVFMSRYRLDSLLGQGGMGSVWKAEHLQLRSPVAIKMLDPAIANNEQMLARFLREAQACAALRSPHVVQIFDYGVDEATGTAFIAMEMLNGEALSDRVTRLGRLPPEEAFRFLSEVLRAMGKAHDAGIVHRDLKPDNVFICRDDPEFAKVLDFGVAKVTNKELGASGGKTQTGMMIGTPYYMSPEQTQAKEVDHRADLWAIAVIAFEIMTGRRPFIGESFGELVIAICTNPVPLPSRVAPVPAGFDEWFVRGTQRDRNRRFQSAKEMAEELGRLASGGFGRPSIVSGAPAFGNSRPPQVASLPAARANSPVPFQPPASDELQLTTGARAVMASGPGPVSIRSGGSRTAILVLAGLAALIVVGVGAFVAIGGAAAFRDVKEEGSAAAAIAPPPEPAPAANPAPVIPPTVAVPVPIAPPELGATLPTSASAAPSASAKALEPSPDKPAREPVKTGAKVAAPNAPRTAPPKGPEKQPPKNWEF
jgi:serine/threonine protein kinase